MIDANCPRCGSKQTKSLSMIYNSGTTVTSRSSTARYRKGRYRGTSSTSVRQTQLASAAAPPKAPVNVLGCLVGGIGLLLTWGIVKILLPAIEPALHNLRIPAAAFTFLSWLPLVSGIVAAWAIHLLLKPLHNKKRRAYERDYADWQNRWLCMRCGATWSYS